MNSDKPRQVEINISGSVCDQCKKSLDNRKSIWIWDYFFACSRPCIIKIKEAETELDL